MTKIHRKGFVYLDEIHRGEFVAIQFTETNFYQSKTQIASLIPIETGRVAPEAELLF